MLNLDTSIRDVLPPKFVRLVKRVKRKFIDRASQLRFYRQLEMLLGKNTEINRLFPYEDLKSHYVYEPARQTIEHPDIFVNQVRYYRLYHFFKGRYPEMFSNETSVVDVGDSSGVLLRAMGRKGLSVNINPEVVDYIRSRGIDAEVGDIENLPFADRSFDYCICLECVEHVNNPIKALSELSRIARKLVFVSVPYVSKTKIYSRDYWREMKMKPVEEGGWNVADPKTVDGHKFEFSTEDFRKIITHADMDYVDSYPINYFSPLGECSKNLGSFFNFFILRPSARTEVSPSQAND